MLEKCRVVPQSIVDARVVMIAHRDGEQHLDVETSSRFGETIDKGVVRFPVGAHEELPLRTPARDHVRLAGQNLTREGHPHYSAGLPNSVVKINLGGARRKSTLVGLGGFRQPTTSNSICAGDWAVSSALRVSGWLPPIVARKRPGSR